MGKGWLCEKCGKDFATEKEAERHEKNCKGEKIEKKENISKEKINKTDKTIFNSLLQIIGWIILMALVFWFFFGGSGDKYEDCVNECVEEMDWCVSNYYQMDSRWDWWIQEFDYEDCSIDLNYCVRSCRR
jgi:Fe2+ transport system protein B